MIKYHKEKRYAAHTVKQIIAFLFRNLRPSLSVSHLRHNLTIIFYHKYSPFSRSYTFIYKYLLSPKIKSIQRADICPLMWLVRVTLRISKAPRIDECNSQCLIKLLFSMKVFAELFSKSDNLRHRPSFSTHILR